MTSRFPHLMRPLGIGPVEARNRFFMPAHGLGLVAAGPNGSRVPSEDMVHYYVERAAAGVGLFILSTAINPRDGLSCAYHPDGVPAFAAVAEGVHRESARMFAQLAHYYNHRLPWEPLGQMAPVLGASAYSNYEHHFGCHEMSPDDIAEVVDQHRACAANLAAAGYDGIEVHCAHGMLAEQFVSPYFNTRNDEYGGSFEGRLRFLIEVLIAIRAAVGDELAVGIRLNCDEMLPGGLTQDDARQVLAAVCDRGLLDFVNLDISVEPQQGSVMVAPQFVEPLHMASFIRSVGVVARERGVVVMGCPGRLTRIQQAEDLLTNGDMDMVGAVRSLIAEPELLRNTLQGREDRNRTCLSCNFCISSFDIGAGWGCAINPAVGRERRWGVDHFSHTGSPAKLVVVGGGPAGMEAARVAARRGHRVVLFERASRLGGQLNLWGLLPDRDLMLKLRDWYEGRLEEAGVDVRIGVDATTDLVLEEQPDSVLIAGGSRYVADGTSGFLNRPIPGWDQPHVHTPEAILEGGVRPSGRVLVLDEEGHHAAAGIAELLARGGAQLELLTRNPKPLEPLHHSLEFACVLPRLKAARVRITPDSYLSEIRAGEVTVYDIYSNEPQVREVDAVVLVTMRRPLPSLAAELRGRVDQLLLIGDAAAARGLVEATFEAHRFARSVGEPDAPRTMAQALFSPPPSESFARSAAATLSQAPI